MALPTKPDGRQYVLSALTDAISYADLTSAAPVTAVVQVPQNAIVVGGRVIVETAFNSATSDVISVGDPTSANRYLSGGNIAALGAVDLVPTGYSVGSADVELQFTWTGTGAAPSAGSIRIEVQYIVDGRHNENQG